MAFMTTANGCADDVLPDMHPKTSPNNRVQRAVNDKVHGRGRGNVSPNQLKRARVLNELRPVADAGR
jgi:hypothetical protein